MHKALITGITGQTGSYLAQEFSEIGWEVHGLSTGALPHGKMPGVYLHELDLLDRAATQKKIHEILPDVVINLAAVSSVSTSWENPLLTFDTNVMPVVNILDTISKIEIERFHKISFIQASSSEIFGLSTCVPIVEQSKLSPSNPYGASKAAAHVITNSYKASGINASNAILFNHESPRRPETFVTRKITKGVARISKGLQDKIMLGDITVSRDWGWAPDYAHALRLMAESPNPRDYVIATGEAHTIEEFVQIAFGCIGISDWNKYVEIDPTLIRKTESKIVVGNAELIRNDLGWKPRVLFPEMIKRMVLADLEQINQE
ncbi:GDP-mannose 4,6-dehydratase [Aurantimicrobium minutum]|nr:GDP-mannose 4,6-dehydratase [Aurantimicrobium minutum]